MYIDLHTHIPLRHHSNPTSVENVKHTLEFQNNFHRDLFTAWLDAKC